jgi:hypothetical protein
LKDWADPVGWHQQAQTMEHLKPKYWRKDKSLKVVNLYVLTWFDKLAGNTYFAATLTVNNKYTMNIPFQYGCRSHADTVAGQLLVKLGMVSKCSGADSLWKICKNAGIDTNSPAYTVTATEALQRELKQLSD